MAELILEAEVRRDIGKRAKNVRHEGKIPGIYYSHGRQPIPLSVDERKLRPLVYTSETHIVDLRLAGERENYRCILKDVQFDPVSDNIIHFDLLGIRADEEITIEVPIVLVGTPTGVKAGGILQHSLHRIRISCLPKNIPQHIEVNVEGLEIGDSVHAGSLEHENFRILANDEATVAAVVPPTLVKEEAAPEAVEGAAVEGEEIKEPEVVGKGKKAEEEETEE